MPNVAAQALRNGAEGKLTVFAHSMGAGIFVAGATSEQFSGDHFGDALLLQPLTPPTPEGTDRRSLGRARRQYLRQFLRNKPPFGTRDDRRTFYDAAARNVYDFVTGRAKMQLNYALTHPMYENVLDYVEKGHTVILSFGDQDPISLVKMYQDALNASGRYDGKNPQIQITEGVVHTTTHLPQGKGLIRRGLQAMRR